MPPKAKGKAKAFPKAKGKAKARPGFGARRGVPAARVRIRRPAALEEKSVEFRFNAGEEVICEEVGPFAWTPDLLVSFTGHYWGGSCRVAGHVKSYRREGDIQELSLRLAGTNHERWQSWGIANKGVPLRVHLCSPRCGGEKVEDDYFHAHKAIKVGPGNEEPWMKSLEFAVDEMPDLQLAVEGIGPAGKAPGGEVPPEPPAEGEKKDEKSKKKRKKEEKEKTRKERKEKKEKKRVEEKRITKVSSSTSSSSETLAKKNPGKKSLEAVFGDAGLDPSPRRRRKLRKKVRRSLKKSKKKKRSSDSSQTASTSSMASGDHLFQENRKVKVIGAKMPGALTAQSVLEMQESLLTASGQVWNSQEGSVPPLAVHYFRTVLQPRMSGGIAREALTLSMLVDMALQGRVAESLDIAIQRLKALELVSRGTDFRVAQRLELCPLELDAMASTTERREAIQESKEEAKLKYQSAKGGDYWKGDWKGSSKDSWGKKGEGKKGSKKGGEKGDDRGKNSGEPDKKK